MMTATEATMQAREKEIREKTIIECWNVIDHMIRIRPKELGHAGRTGLVRAANAIAELKGKTSTVAIAYKSQ